MPSRYVLSRLRITGLLDEGTPSFIVKFIARCHGIKYSDKDLDNLSYNAGVVALVNKCKVCSIEEPFNNDILPLIARYVNPFSTGSSKESLIRCFKYLATFHDRQDTSIPYPNFKYGNITDCETLDCTIIYAMCRDHGIKMSRSTTEEDLCLYARHLCRIKHTGKEYCLSRIEEKISKVNNDEMVKMSVLCKVNPTISNLFTYADLEVKGRLYRNMPNAELKKITPMNAGQAITLSALLWKVDISSCSWIVDYYATNKHSLSNNVSVSSAPHLTPFHIARSTILDTFNIPSVEQRVSTSLGHNPAIASKLKPWDITSEAMLKKCPNYYNLNTIFNRSFPISLYNKDTLSDLLEKEGYQDVAYMTEDVIYSELQTLSFMNTFHDGWRPGISNKQTIVDMDEVEDILPSAIICFGVQGESMIATTEDELEAYFRARMSFQNFLIDSTESFSERALDKLIFIANKRGNVSLGSYVHNIRKMASSDMATLRRVKDLYDALPEDREIGSSPEGTDGENNKVQVRACLESLLHMSMYMRGWRGPSHPYPLDGTHNEKQEDIDVRVAGESHIFHKRCTDLGDIGTAVLNVVTVRYKNGHMYTRDALSLRKRIKTFQEGRDVDSCIRITSNWLAATAHTLMVKIGMPEPFETLKLKDIS